MPSKYDAEERAFRNALMRIMGSAHASIATVVSGYDPSNPTKFGEINGYLLTTETSFLRAMQSRISNVLLKYGAKSATEATADFEKQFVKFGIKPTFDNDQIMDVMDKFVENVTFKLEGITQEVFSDIRRAVTVGYNEGWSYKRLGDHIMERFGVSQSRARFIARNELSTIYSDVTKRRQQNAGVSKYIWRTSRDARVRDSHEELEGKTFSWDAPPSVGHPGQDYLCRCTAEPIIDLGVEI